MPFRRLYPAALLIALPCCRRASPDPDLPERYPPSSSGGTRPARVQRREAVVCARGRAAATAFFRDRPERPTEVAWGSRVESLDEASAQARPNSCSVVGSYGQSGCQQQFISQWYASRRAARAANAGIP